MFAFISHSFLLSSHKNRTNENVRMLWIDYDGNHQPYKLLKPGQRHRQQTYLTHPWTFKTASSREEEHSDDGEDEEVGGRGRGEEEEEGERRELPERLVIRDSPVFYPPPETMDSEEDSGDDEGDMAPSSGGRSSAEVFSITYPKTVTNWSPRTNKTLKCYQSNAFQSAVRETLRVWTFAHAKREEDEEKEEEEEKKATNEQQTEASMYSSPPASASVTARITTLSDIPKDVLVNEIIRRFAPEPPYYNLMLCT